MLTLAYLLTANVNFKDKSTRKVNIRDSVCQVSKKKKEKEKYYKNQIILLI